MIPISYDDVIIDLMKHRFTEMYPTWIYYGESKVTQGVDEAEHHFDDEYLKNLSTALNNSLDQDNSVVPDSFHNTSEVIELEKVASEIDENDDDFKDIVRGPIGFATRYKKYSVNGFLFVIKEYEATKQYQNSGVITSPVTTLQSSSKDKNPLDESRIYYGILTDIIQLEYHKGYKPFLFRCYWDRITRQGVKWDKEANLKLVNFSNIISSNKFGDEPFILAEHATQVFYFKDPRDPDWNVVIEALSKVYVEDEACLSSEERFIGDSDIGPSNDTLIHNDEMIFNDSGCVVPIVEKSKKRKRMQDNYGASGYFLETGGTNKRKHVETIKLTKVSVSDKLESFRVSQEVVVTGMAHFEAITSSAFQHILDITSDIGSHLFLDGSEHFELSSLPGIFRSGSCLCHSEEETIFKALSKTVELLEGNTALFCQYYYGCLFHELLAFQLADRHPPVQRECANAKFTEMIGFSSFSISVLNGAKFSAREADNSSLIHMDADQSFLSVPAPVKAASLRILLDRT
ncbi:hypothetical protein GIB67_003414 [Kingdonia uniflora]|uniref:DUF4216 domain-containing protein n=1 Tax=Kingdonia uniflora TaxID=39325 RepID=A0A7J7P925_9MAGN|nr:hypothetical protein GIB67_003414 [Kingdonia uniflora]